MAYDIDMGGIHTADGTRLQSVRLRHQPEDADKIIRRREFMMANGWLWRPVILARAGDHHIALTGAHRLAAAQGLDVTIKAVYLPDDLTEADWDEINSANDEDGLLAALIAIGKGRKDMDKAVDVMHAEVMAS